MENSLKTIASIHKELLEERNMVKKENSNSWQWDKRIPVTMLGGMIIQTIIMVWFCAAFYTQTNANQDKNETRFSQLADQKKVSDKRADDIQSSQNQIQTQLAGMNERINAQTDVIKDIREILRTKPHG